MTITSENPTKVQRPDRDGRAWRSHVTWADNAQESRPDASSDASSEPGHRRYAPRSVRLVALLAVGALCVVLCVGMLALTASGNGSAPARATKSATATPRPHVAITTIPAGTARPYILQCRSGSGTDNAQRFLLPVPTLPCAVRSPNPSPRSTE